MPIKLAMFRIYDYIEATVDKKYYWCPKINIFLCNFKVIALLTITIEIVVLFLALKSSSEK